jgi:14-3-3 protein epsilon
VKRIKEYMKKMEVKLDDTCNDIMIMIDENLIPSSTTRKSFVFYYKMKDNYYMYLVEFKNDNERKKKVVS